jgi:hypothetical protein
MLLVIKLRRTGDMRNTHRTFLENLKERNCFGDLGIDRRIILK